jgi:hypothetical protein
MAFTYVGQAVKEDNVYNVGEALTSVASTQEGDLWVLSGMTRGNVLFGAPSGWTTVQSVNNNNTATNGRASGIVAYIVQGASAPDLVLTGHAAAINLRALVKVYRPGVGETVSLVGSSLLDESSAGTSTHPHASITGLQADDLLCMEMASGGISNAWFGAAGAATDPATASDAPTSSAHGAVTTTGMPSAGSWVNRYSHKSTTGVTLALFSADGVASASGASGQLTFDTRQTYDFLGATLAFRAAVSGGGGSIAPILNNYRRRRA